MKKVIAKIVSNEEVSAGFFKMALSSAYLARSSRPGQFIEIRCSDGVEPLLRRPLGVHRITPGGIELLYRVIGKGTSILSCKRKGEEADVLGPLGNGFDMNSSSSALLVAGGIGIAPIVALAQRLKRAEAIIGGRAASHILCEKELRSYGCYVKVATEDGSKGHKGLVTDLLKRRLEDGRAKPKVVYACGPNPMLRSVAAITRAHGIRCQVSLEERMACGAGVCLGCPVKVRPGGEQSEQSERSERSEYKMVCKDGPVFDAQEIIW